MNVAKMKERALTAAVIIGFALAGIVFWKLVSAFMWLCYYLGISM